MLDLFIHFISIQLPTATNKLCDIFENLFKPTSFMNHIGDL